MIKRREILLFVFCFSLLLRLLFFSLIRDSLFLSYHLVPGLDMQTLLRFSEWGPGGSGISPFFTLHRCCLYLLWKLGGGSHPVSWLFLIQTLTGTLGATALADLALMLTGKRKTALAAGCIMAAALPPLIYEFSVLQECFSLNLLLFAVWSTFWAKKRRFPAGRSLCAGSLWALSLAGRPAAVFAAAGVFCVLAGKIRRQKRYKKGILLLFAATLAMLAGASFFNALFGWRYGPFYHVLPYTMAYNAGLDAVQQGKSVTPGIWHSAEKALKRVPRLFSALELPENQNLYFWREKHPFLFLFPGPGILMAFSLSGMLLLLAGKRRKKALIPLSLIALLALPLCAREPIGRYRLMLWPWLILMGSFGFGYWSALPAARKPAAMIAAALTALIWLRYGWVARHYLRLSDYHAWALAAQGKYGHGEKSLGLFAEMWEKSGCGSDSAFQAYVWEALQCDRPDIVARTIREARETGKVCPDLIAYYQGAIFIRANDASKVKQIFSAIDPEKLPPSLRRSIPEILAETERILHAEREKK